MGTIFIKIVSLFKKKRFDNTSSKEFQTVSSKEHSSPGPLPSPITFTKRFDCKVYSTSSTEYPTWLDVIINKCRLSTSMVIVLLGIFPFLIGLVFSSLIGFANIYIHSKAIYLGIFGIIWVLSIIRSQSQQFHKAYEQLRPCFLIEDEAYKKLIHKWFALFSSHPGNISISLLFAIISWVVTFMSFFGFKILSRIGIESLRPSLFTIDWYMPDKLIVKAIIIAFWGLCIAFPFGTSFRMIVLNQRFLFSLRDMPMIPLPDVIYSRLQKIANIYVVVTFTWLIGVAMWGVLLFDKLDIISFICLLVLSSIGVLTFFTPQFIYRGFLLRSHFISSQWLLCSFYKKLNIDLLEKNITMIPIEIGCKLTEANSIIEFAKASARSKSWIYNPSDFIWLIIGQIAAIGSLYVKELLIVALR